MQNRTAHAFSLIEIMVVIAIIGMLSAIIVPSIADRLEKARWLQTQAQVRNLSDSIDQFHLDMGHLPEKLEQLVRNPGSNKWGGPYFKPPKVPADAWERTITYQMPGNEGRPYELFSYASDGLPGGERWSRDISCWE